jgi:hypothetical protein
METAPSDGTPICVRRGEFKESVSWSADVGSLYQPRDGAESSKSNPTVATDPMVAACRSVGVKADMFVFYSNTVGLLTSILVSIALTLLLLYACRRERAHTSSVGQIGTRP